MKNYQPVLDDNEKALAKSDIVFCIDISTSMTPCIEGVKNNVKNFIETIENDPEISIDWRLGLLAHSWLRNDKLEFWIKDFTTDVQDFKRAVSELRVIWNEVNLPALDWSLDFPWRKDAHKFVVMFTDEPVDGGWEPERSREKIEELKSKIEDLGASVYIVSFEEPEFQDYRTITEANKCEYIGISDYSDFSNVKFDKLMEKIGKKVSSGSRGRVSEEKPVKKDIYGVADIVTIKKL